MDKNSDDDEAIRILKLTDRALEVISSIIRAKVLFAVPATAAFVVFLSGHHYDGPYVYLKFLIFGLSIAIIVYTSYLAYFLSFIELSRFAIVQAEFAQEWRKGLESANDAIKMLGKLISIEKILWPMFTISLVSLLLSITFKAVF